MSDLAATGLHISLQKPLAWTKKTPGSSDELSTAIGAPSKPLRVSAWRLGVIDAPSELVLAPDAPVEPRREFLDEAGFEHLLETGDLP